MPDLLENSNTVMTIKNSGFHIDIYCAWKGREGSLRHETLTVSCVLYSYGELFSIITRSEFSLTKLWAWEAILNERAEERTLLFSKNFISVRPSFV